MNDASYHKTVADYYDEEAHSFEERAHTNPLLGHLRQRFRDVVLEGETSALLEIGYGPGLDMGLVCPAGWRFCSSWLGHHPQFP